MVVYILSSLLIAILAFAIVQLSTKSEVEAEIKKLKKRNQLSLIAELHTAEKVVWLCFTGGLLLTANYAITYFSGSELVNIPNWGFLQWSGAFIGLVIAVSITFVQKVLYSSPTHSKAGLVVTTLVLTFVIISEIGAPIEKEGMKMKEASQNSAVFKAVVSGIIGKTDVTSSYSSQIAAATAEKAQHEFELGRCERHADKGEKRVKRCEDYESRLIAQAQAKIESYQSSANTTTSSNESSRLALIQQAKALEQNTDNHSELVKLTASMLGASFLSSMMFLSLVLIVAFEAGFHFVGSRIGVLKTALGEMGNKEILRKQELSSLKKEKAFKDQSGYIDPNNDLKVNSKVKAKEQGEKSRLSIPKVLIPNVDNKASSSSSITAFNPTADILPNDLGFKPIPVKQNKDKHLVGQARVDTDKLTMPTQLEQSTKHALGASNFNDLYLHIKKKIETKEITLSIRNMRKVAHAYVKSHTKMKGASISMPDTHYLVDKVRDKMIKDHFIIENPNYSRGKVKYLLAEKKNIVNAGVFV